MGAGLIEFRLCVHPEPAAATQSLGILTRLPQYLVGLQLALHPGCLPLVCLLCLVAIGLGGSVVPDRLGCLRGRFEYPQVVGIPAKAVLQHAQGLGVVANAGIPLCQLHVLVTSHCALLSRGRPRAAP